MQNKQPLYVAFARGGTLPGTPCQQSHIENKLKGVAINGGIGVMNGVRRIRRAAFVLLAASAMAAETSSVSAQTSGAEAVKMLDTDNDGTVDLAECKTAGAATFEKLDADKSTTLDQEELGGRAVVGLVEAPIRRMFFQTRPSKNDYLAAIARQFDLADSPDHDGKLDPKEFETDDGRRLLNLLR
jgi:hypothetical protein